MDLCLLEEVPDLGLVWEDCILGSNTILTEATLLSTLLKVTKPLYAIFLFPFTSFLFVTIFIVNISRSMMTAAQPRAFKS